MSNDAIAQRSSHGHHNSDGTDRNTSKQHMLWLQTIPSLFSPRRRPS